MNFKKKSTKKFKMHEITFEMIIYQLKILNIILFLA